LFFIFINDLPEYVTSNARLFADDCLLYRVINNNNDQHQLQNDLQQLEIWEKKWQMQFKRSEYRALGHPKVYITGGRVCAV
jgi:hypothetical protein